jgi:predicted nucleotidyltransferase
MTLKNLHRAQVKSILSEEQVLFAYVFGSQVRGDVGMLSDIDMAVYFHEHLNASQRFHRKLKVMAKLSLLFKRDDIDVVILNEAYPLLEHRIIRGGEVIFSRDEKRRINYEVRAVMRYLDFKPFLESYTRETLDGR